MFYMAEHLIVDLLYHYHMNKIYAFSGPLIMEFTGVLILSQKSCGCLSEWPNLGLPGGKQNF